MNVLGVRPLALCAALALPALALPLGAHAESPATAAAVQACTEDLAANMRAQVIGDYYNYQSYSPLQVFVRPAQLLLTAQDPSTHQVIARAVCTYNSAGQVLSLQREPSDTVLPMQFAEAP